MGQLDIGDRPVVNEMETSLLTLASRLRGEQEGDLGVSLAELAESLSRCEPEAEEMLCTLVDRSGALPPLMERLRSGLDDDHLFYVGLSALVNLADVGGAELVLRHGGLQLFLSVLDSEDLSARYYACAGIQNLTSDAFIVSAFAHELGSALDEAESRLGALLRESQYDETEDIVRCAAGALANIQAVPAASEYTASVTPSPSDRSHCDDDADDEVVGTDIGRGEASESLEAKLARAVHARVTYEKEMTIRQHTAARVVQRHVRQLLAVDSARRRNNTGEGEARAGRSRSPAGIREAQAELDRVTAATRQAAAVLQSPREPVEEYTCQVHEAVMHLARLLTNVVGPEAEAHAVQVVESYYLVRPLVLLLVEHLHAPDPRLLYVGLSVLVNLADMGGIELVHQHGGMELFIGLLRAADLSVRYYAVAGVQNMTSAPECAVRVRGTGVESLLEVMLDCGNEQIERCAAGALANIRRAVRTEREKQGAAANSRPRQPGQHRTPRFALDAPTAPDLHKASAQAQRGHHAQDNTGDGRGAVPLRSLPVGAVGTFIWTVASLPLRPLSSLFRRQMVHVDAKPVETQGARSPSAHGAHDQRDSDCAGATAVMGRQKVKKNKKLADAHDDSAVDENSLTI